MKKIALYIPDMNSGGAEKVFMILANHFSDRGYDVDLLLTIKRGAFIEHLNANINIIELSSKRVLFDFFKFRSYLIKSDPDVIISALGHSNLLSAMCSITCGYEKRLFVTEHSNFTESMKEKNFLKRNLLKLLVKFSYDKLAGVIGVSKGVKVDIVDNFPSLSSKSTFIYNPFDVDEVFKKSQENVSHRWLGEDRDYKTVISVGRLTQAKDFQSLLLTFLTLRDRCNIRLIILGEGELRKELSEFINNNNLNSIVDLYGFVDNPFSFIKKSDLFVLSSKREGFSNVLVESMICNVPIVSTDCPSGPAEILEGGIWGELVPVGDPDVLAEVIYKKLYNNSKKMDYSSRINDFRKEKIGDEYLSYVFSNLN